MEKFNRYIKHEDDGSVTGMINPPLEEAGWIKTDVYRIVAEPGYILFHNGVCYGADIADVEDITGWTEHPMSY